MNVRWTFRTASDRAAARIRIPSRFYTSSYFRPWRSWITQQIPILKIGGSNPFGRAKYQGNTVIFCGVLFFARRDSNPERVSRVKKTARRAVFSGEVRNGFAARTKMRSIFIPSGGPKSECRILAIRYSFCVFRLFFRESAAREKVYSVCKTKSFKVSSVPPYDTIPPFRKWKNESAAALSLVLPGRETDRIPSLLLNKQKIKNLQLF